MSTATMKTTQGDITIELFDGEAPKTVENFKKLAADGFYDGLTFHRIIKDFMIQERAARSAPAPVVRATRSRTSSTSTRSSAARSPWRTPARTRTASQFFIVTTGAAPWLDGKHTVFGEVTAGLGVVDQIERPAHRPPGPSQGRVQDHGAHRRRLELRPAP